VTRTDLKIDQTSWANARPSFSRDEARIGPPFSIPFGLGGAWVVVMVERSLVIKDRVDLRRDVRDIWLPRFPPFGIFQLFVSYPIPMERPPLIYETRFLLSAIGANTPINEKHVFPTFLYCVSSN